METPICLDVGCILQLHWDWISMAHRWHWATRRLFSASILSIEQAWNIMHTLAVSIGVEHTAYHRNQPELKRQSVFLTAVQLRLSRGAGKSHWTPYDRRCWCWPDRMSEFKAGKQTKPAHMGEKTAEEGLHNRHFCFVPAYITDFWSLLDVFWWKPQYASGSEVGTGQ